MADSNLYGLSLAKSSARAFPLGAPDPLNLTALRITGTPNFGFRPISEESQEIRKDRQPTDQVLVGGEAGGTAAFELSYGAFDTMIEASVLNVFVNTQIDSGVAGITAFGAGTVDVADGTKYKENHIVELRNPASGSLGRGIYFVDLIAANQLVTSVFDADTNAITGSFTAQDADPSNDIPATELQVVGMRADANGELALTVDGPTSVATLTATGLTDFLNIYGDGRTVAVGDQVKLRGMPLATSNVDFRVTGIDTGAGTMTFDAPDDLVDDAAAAVRPRIFVGDRLINGAQPLAGHQFAGEAVYEYMSPVGRQLMLGLSLDQFNLAFQPQKIIVGDINFIGQTAKISTGENDPTGNDILYASGLVLNRLESAQNDVYNTSSHVTRIAIGASPVATLGKNYVLGSTLRITNNLERINAEGVFGAAAVRVGEFGAGGTMQTLFDTIDLLELVLDNADTSFDRTMVGFGGRAVTFDMPRIKITGQPDVPGKNTNVTMSANFSALRHKTLNFTMSVTRFPFVG